MKAPPLRRVELASLSTAEREQLVRRSAVPDPAVRDAALAICDEVRHGGDAALEAAAARYGGGRDTGLQVDPAEMKAALEGLPRELVEALQHAIENVRTWHRAQLPVDLSMETVPGVRVARRWAPLRRIGAYVPGGSAAYPSTLIMTVVPAQVAGVEEIAVASPAAPNGDLAPVLLAAAALLGVEEFYVMGGAQAVAALAYGTETIRPVDKIVGPGNPWVTAAKLAVLGECAIDMPAGPSEVLVLADETADARLVAVDLLCQAEHGPDSPAVLVTADPDLPARVQAELARLLPDLERRQVLAEALREHGLVVIAPDHQAARSFADDYAAEHVTVLTADAEADAKALRGAGSVYVGRWSPESAGDYATGANHVLPTGGLARACGPLGVEDFGSWRQVQTLSRDGLQSIRSTIGDLAAAEGLTAHRLAAELRFEEQP